MKQYLVGGWVRDSLLGCASKDKDWVVVGATEADLLAQGFTKVGKGFPVFLNPTTGEEYALARKERRTGKGYYGFECEFGPEVTLEQDLLRRDLTINAMAQADSGEIIDPYGGQRDLNNRVLRHVSPAFVEDPLRVLRVARFAARFAHLGFGIAPDTLDLMTQMVKAEELTDLVPERVWQEMEKALAAPQPHVFFESLREIGALAVLFPALDALWGVPQNPEYHPEIDTGLHTMLALQKAASMTQDTVTRFGVLCHDLGKGLTPPQQWPSHRGHEQRGEAPIKAWCKQYKVPNRYRDFAVKLAVWHLHTHRALELRPETIVKLFRGLNAVRQPEGLEAFLLACQADAQGRTGMASKPYPQADYLAAAFKQMMAIDTTAIVAAVSDPKARGEAILAAQVAAVREFKQAYSNMN